MFFYSPTFSCDLERADLVADIKLIQNRSNGIRANYRRLLARFVKDKFNGNFVVRHETRQGQRYHEAYIVLGGMRSLLEQVGADRRSIK